MAKQVCWWKRKCYFVLISWFLAAFALPTIQLVHERLKDLYGCNNNKVGEFKSEISTAKVVRLNENDRDLTFDATPTLSCRIQSNDPSAGLTSTWCGARATHGVNKGSFYIEFRIQGESPVPTCRVGWSTIAAHLELGKDKHGTEIYY